MSVFLTSQAVAGDPLQQSAPRTGPVVGLIDEVQEPYPDTKLDQPVKRFTVHSAGNTTAAVHVMITGASGIPQIQQDVAT